MKKKYIELLLVSLTFYRDELFDKKELKSKLPFNFNISIEEIIKNEVLVKKFDKFIDFEQYFINKELFEYKLSEDINYYLKEKNKKIDIDLYQKVLLVPFSMKEINEIIKKFDDDVLDDMQHLANLIYYLQQDKLKESYYNEETQKVLKH